MATAYAQKGDIKVFPSVKRSDQIPSARLGSEESIAGLVKSVVDNSCYAISDSQFVLNGRLFTIDKSNVPISVIVFVQFFLMMNRCSFVNKFSTEITYCFVAF